MNVTKTKIVENAKSVVHLSSDSPVSRAAEDRRSLKQKKEMLPQMKKVIADNPKKVAELIDLVNLPSTLREFMGQSQSSRLGCFKHVWSYIKDNNLQDPTNKNLVNCDEKLKRILLGKGQVDLVELPMLIKLHFPRQQK
ncbi:OLC1v1022639C1 [Oldenlandia corymbosa var. corymbosa]|uniref:OLC1v1022639C1 n=1 Tax=Oldenlandia corymbosa var. corymbosa TaxID=529605 RepID=A0AAV1BY91_OLDCO|nr:OLC1v1022639C1 [Oldenlandia corymbosa var. corymbosa]